MASWLYSAARRVALASSTPLSAFASKTSGGPTRAERPGRSPHHQRTPGLSSTRSSIGSPSRSGPWWCSVNLQGHSYEEAAGMLHCPVGTVQSRLARGRQRLRKRLEVRGISSAVILVGTGAGLTARPAMAAVSPRLTTALAKTAVALTGGQSITALVPNTVAGLVGTEIRRLLMSRTLTILTTLVTAGLVAAAGIRLVVAGQREEPQSNQVTANESMSARDSRSRCRLTRPRRAGSRG